MRKQEKIDYINNACNINIQAWESYTSKEIDVLYKAVKQGKKIIKLGYTWVIETEATR